MKRIFTLLTVAMGLMLPMQAQQAITKDINAERGVERKMARKAPAAEISVEDIVGTYDAVAGSAFQGKPDQVWTVTIEEDEADAGKVWIQPICTFMEDMVPVEYINPVYATFDAAQGTLTMPLGQVLYEEQGVRLGTGASQDGQNIDTNGDVVMTITKNDKGVVITFAEQYFIGIGVLDDPEQWWYQAVHSVTYTKAIPVPFVYIYNKGVTSPARVKASQLYFNDVEGEMCVTTTPEYSNTGIAGVYEAYAESAFQGNPAESWTVTITVDEADANKVWIQPICLFGVEPEYVRPVYAIYNEAEGTLAMPLGQVLMEEGGYKMVIGATSDGKIVETTGDYMMEVVDIVIASEARIIGVGDANDPDGWWYNALMGFVFSIEVGQAFPLAEIEKITREEPEVSGDFMFIKPGDYTWSFLVPVSETEAQEYTTTASMELSYQMDLSDLFGDEAAGIIGNVWSLTGFMQELGIFNEEETYSIPVLSYSLTDEEGTFEVLSFIDPGTSGWSVLGTTVMEDESGNQFNVELLLGDVTGQNINTADFVAFSEEEIIYAGEQPVLWFIYEGQAYLFSYLYEMEVALDPETRGARIKATVGEKPAFINQAIPMNVSGISMRK